LRLVLAVRNIGGRDVGDTRQRIGEFGRELALFVFGGRQRGLDLRDFGLQLFGELGILLAHCDADLLGGGIAARLHFLRLLNDSTAAFVERDERVGERLGATSGERRIEGGRIVTNPFDIEHGDTIVMAGRGKPDDSLFVMGFGPKNQELQGKEYGCSCRLRSRRLLLRPCFEIGSFRSSGQR
jgi:hypothetical protein